MSIDRDRLSEERSFQEETAAEFTPRLPAPVTKEKHEDIDNVTKSSIQEVQEGTGSGAALGMVGLVLSLISLFTLPFLLSLMGIGAGLFAYRRGIKGLGKWAIGIGLISIIGSMMFAPFLG